MRRPTAALRRKGRGEPQVGWLFVAALALTLLAGWCASAESALIRVSRAGAKELNRSAGEPSTPLQAVLAEITRYLSVLLFARVAAEIGATVLMTVVLLHWIGNDWRAFLSAAAIMTVLIYVATGVVPRTQGRERAVRVASAAASVMRPVNRLLGPVPRILLAAGSVAEPRAPGRAVRVRGGGSARPGGPAGAAPGDPAG